MSSNQLVRTKNDRMVAGVAGGLAQYFNVDPTLVRLLFVIFTLAGGPGLLAYIILWIVMAEERMGSSGYQQDDSDEDIIIEKGA